MRPVIEQLELPLVSDHKARARERILAFNFVRGVALEVGFTPREARAIAGAAVRRREAR